MILVFRSRPEQKHDLWKTHFFRSHELTDTRKTWAWSKPCWD